MNKLIEEKREILIDFLELSKSESECLIYNENYEYFEYCNINYIVYSDEEVEDLSNDYIYDLRLEMEDKLKDCFTPNPLKFITINSDRMYKDRTFFLLEDVIGNYGKYSNTKLLQHMNELNKKVTIKTIISITFITSDDFSNDSLIEEVRDTLNRSLGRFRL